MEDQIQSEETKDQIQSEEPKNQKNEEDEKFEKQQKRDNMIIGTVVEGIDTFFHLFLG